MDPSWTDVLAATDLDDDAVVGVDVKGLDIAVYSVGGSLYATDNICTHGAALLCDGFLEGHEIECPMHQGRFDVRTGAAMSGPVSEGLRTYPIRIEAGRILLALPEAGTHR